VCVRQHQFMDVVLGGAVVATDVLADFDARRRSRAATRSTSALTRRSCRITSASFSARSRVQREQAGIAGAGTDQAHNADRRRIGNRNGRRT
jgi:hypothetical protein